MFRRFTQRVESAFQVDIDKAVECCIVGFGNGGKRHNTRIIHQHIHAAKRLFRAGKHPADRRRVADIRLRADSFSACLFNFSDHRVGFCRTA
ncbi:hypothetical protein SRABI106_03124 [Rahnella aquatilis]|nr:hypothetical protein SRABI106_03124 [Rahnella aquatilis]